jgi:hypothetical protein
MDNAKQTLDKIIEKGRVHLYKPIQIAEILHRHRVHNDIDPVKVETYRNASKAWRNAVTDVLVGRSSNSSSVYQDNIFNDNAMPPSILAILAGENIAKNGIVEAYIYRQFSARFSQTSSAIAYCEDTDRTTFNILEFIKLFRNDPGLRRSIDKVYEIVVYALFDTLIATVNVTVTVETDPARQNILHEFENFASMIIGLKPGLSSYTQPAKLYRVGITNASDRGLVMHANFGMTIQIKHLSLNTDQAEGIINTITADRIVIVCRDTEKDIIVSFLNQIGWRSRIQSIVTESHLVDWYSKALTGEFGNMIGDQILLTIRKQIIAEFPATAKGPFTDFYEGRGYDLITDDFWL